MASEQTLPVLRHLPREVLVGAGCLDGLGEATQGVGVGGLPERQAPVVGQVEDGGGLPAHAATEAAVDLVERPGVAAAVMEPLEPADGHAAGVGEDVGDDRDPTVGEDRVGLRAEGSVGHLHDEGSGDAAGVLGGHLVSSAAGISRSTSSSSSSALVI